MNRPTDPYPVSRLAIGLAGAKGSTEVRRLELVYDSIEQIWRTAHPCVAVRMLGSPDGRIHHRAFRCPPRDIAHPEMGPAQPAPLRAHSRFPLYPTRIPEIDSTRPYAVFGWADAFARTGDPAHDDADLCLAASSPTPACDVAERILRAPHEELAAAISGGADPLAAAVASVSDDIVRIEHLRRRLTDRFAYAIPSEAALAALIGLGSLVEIGAGTGYWAALLRARRADIVAYDIAPLSVGPNIFHRGALPWTRVELGGPEQAGLPGRSLLLIWPPLGDPMAARALQKYPGPRLAYIGELMGGCTADDRFFELLDRDWTLEREVALGPGFPFSDNLSIYRRRRAKE